MPNGTCWSMASAPDGGGYWILNASTGVVTTYGDAISYGSPAAQFANVGREFVPEFIDIVSTPDGKGYRVLALGLSGLGSVEHFGDAGFFGDELTPTASSGHVGTPVAMAATPSGNGYWIVDSDGGVFAFGDAGFYGSMGGVRLNAPVVGVAATADGHGYWLAASDGGRTRVRRSALRGVHGGGPLAWGDRRRRWQPDRGRVLARRRRWGRVCSGWRPLRRVHGRLGLRPNPSSPSVPSP